LSYLLNDLFEYRSFRENVVILVEHFDLLKEHQSEVLFHLHFFFNNSISRIKTF
jgi:hypothetical protein